MICSVIALLSLVKFSVGQTLLTYDFNGSLTGSNVLTDLTASDMLIADSNAAFLESGTRLNIIRQDTPVSTQQYFANSLPLLSFTLTANTGREITFSGFRLTLAAGGILNTQISTDPTLTSNLVTVPKFAVDSTVASPGNLTFTTPYVISSGTSQTYYLRFNSGNLISTNYIDKFEVFGTAIPEPSTYVLLFLGFM